MNQKDLFEFSPKAAALPQTADLKPKAGFSFLEQACISLRLDQALAGTMALMVGMAVIYGWGVESGRRLERKRPFVMQQRAEIAPPVAENKTPNVLSAPVPAEPGMPTAVSVQSSTQVNPSLSVITTRPSAGQRPKGAYTIQLATYKAELLAQKKAQALAAQGLEAFVVPSGAFYQICVNGFEERRQAAQSLLRLKSKGIVPKDAYVRLIPA